MANCTRSMSLMMVEIKCAGRVLLKKGRRPPQDGVVKIVAQIGDHAESGVVHQIGSSVVENALQHGGGDQREGNDRPRIVEVRWERSVAGKVVSSCSELVKRTDIFRARRGIQHAIEDGLQQNQPKGFQKPNASQQKDSGQQLHQERKDVADEPRQLPHGAPARARPQSLAAGGISMKCKALFYLSVRRKNGVSAS